MMNVDVNIAKSQTSLDKLMNISSSKNFDDENLEKVATEFEEMMFGNLVKNLFETTEGTALWGEGNSADIMRSMFIDAIAKSGGAKCLNIKACVKKNLYAANNELNEIDRKGKIDVTF